MVTTRSQRGKGDVVLRSWGGPLARKDILSHPNIVSETSKKVLIVSLKITKPIKIELKEESRKPRRTSLRTNKYGFTFGEDPLSAYPRPTQDDINVVSAILSQERPTFVVSKAPTSPMHAGNGVTVDSLVRIIISQVLKNENALDIQQRLIHAYPYVVDGKNFYGTKPNYHSIRVEPLEKLIYVMQKAGLHNTKPVQIKKCLDIIYNENLERLEPGVIAYRGNEPGATDFVPGLLSLDYLSDVYSSSGKQGLLDYLVKFPQVGVKSACCLMSFNMNLPIFAVDTHVANMAKLLGWVPPEVTNENAMCSHLDAVMADSEQKIILHQDFWRHRRSCGRCSGRVKPGGQFWHSCFCPLEHLICRNSKDSDTLEIRAARRRAQNAANGTISSSSPSENSPDPEVLELPKRRSRPVLKKGPSDDELRAQGLMQVAYNVDDDFDANGGGFVKRSIWITDYSQIDFATMFPVNIEDEDDSQYEQFMIRKVSFNGSQEITGTSLDEKDIGLTYINN